MAKGFFVASNVVLTLHAVGKHRADATTQAGNHRSTGRATPQFGIHALP